MDHVETRIRRSIYRRRFGNNLGHAPQVPLCHVRAAFCNTIWNSPSLGKSPWPRSCSVVICGRDSHTSWRALDELINKLQRCFTSSMMTQTFFKRKQKAQSPTAPNRCATTAIYALITCCNFATYFLFDFNKYVMKSCSLCLRTINMMFVR